MDGRDLLVIDTLYRAGAALLTMVLNVGLLTFYMRYLGVYTHGMMLLVAASVTSSGVMAYEMALSALAHKLEEAFNEERTKATIREAIQDDIEHENKIGWAEQKEEREREEERSERSRFPFS